MKRGTKAILILAVCLISAYAGYEGKDLKVGVGKPAGVNVVAKEKQQEQTTAQTEEENDTETEKQSEQDLSAKDINTINMSLQKVDMYVMIGEDSLNIRKEPSTEAEVLGKLQREDIAVASGEKSEDGNWAQITYEKEDGEKDVGWIYVGGEATRHMEGTMVDVALQIAEYYREYANQVVADHNEMVQSANSKISSANEVSQEIYDAYEDLLGKYNDVVDKYNSLQSDYNNVVNDYNTLNQTIQDYLGE